VSRRRAKPDLGEAVSFDSILTILTVLLVLRMVFLVPMVNLDKSKVDQARRSLLWERVVGRLAAGARHQDDASLPYLQAFALQSDRSFATVLPDGRVLVEALSADSTLDVVEHDPATGRFVSLRVQASSEAPVFRRGLLLWSGEESVWFPASDSTDYGQHPSSLELVARLRTREALP
jgi:hypothetical protein